MIAITVSSRREGSVNKKAFLLARGYDVDIDLIQSSTNNASPREVLLAKTK